MTQGKIEAVEWMKLGDLSSVKSAADLEQMLIKVYPDSVTVSGRPSKHCAEIIQFAFEAKPGDLVVTVDRARKWLVVGTIDGPYKFISEEPLRSGGKPYRHTLPVSWMFAVARAKEGLHSFPETSRNRKKSAFWLKDDTVAAIMKELRISLPAHSHTGRRTTANPAPRPMSEAPVGAGADTLSQWLDKNERLAEALPSDELAARAAAANPQARQVEFEGTGFVRDSFVAALAKQLAGGRCDLCAKAAPFRSTDGLPFLESHHVKWLSRNGRDAIDNVVALCPNCHRKMHVRDEKADFEKLLVKIAARS